MSGVLPASACRGAEPLYHVMWLALAAGVLMAAAVLSIQGGSQIVVPVIDQPLPELCSFKRMWGLPCPGCGLTRSCVALVHGELATSWTYNPAGVMIVLLLAFQLPFRLLQLWRIHRGSAAISLGLAVPLTLLGLTALLIGHWAVRIVGVLW